jgi:hypothetical protein
MKLFCVAFGLIIALVAPHRALAFVDCEGTVDTLSIQLNTTGMVTVSLSGGPAYTYLCAVDGTLNGVSATVCRTMYATLVTAKTTGKRVLIRFNDYSSCSAVPAWNFSGTLGWTMVLTD